MTEERVADGQRLVDIEAELRDRLMKLVENQLVGVLSTTSEGEPYSCLVSFWFTENLENLVFATKRARLKYRKMMQNPNVSLIIDDRKNRPDDFQRVISATVMGTARDTEGELRKRYMEALLERHPYLSEFVRAPDTAIIEVSVKRIYIVADFEDVTTVTPGRDNS
ncbi:pyridoxamine 5'-phosphate oxidase family protein [Candidatus Thorarchaeota archaeon]|nr:MAG: pyridoxamine 5'-phosphate oxidase family protein [Candidatus Thorarchaeota archaeon]